MPKTKPVILLDMDDTMFDWTTGFLDLLNQECRQAGVEPWMHDVKEWIDFTDVSNIDHHRLLNRAFLHPDLYHNLRPLPGAVDAYHWLLANDYDPVVCSAPSNANPECVNGKLATLRRFFGAKAVDDLILTTDKTMVRGDVLIDDKPVITGRMTPTWTRVVYDRRNDPSDESFIIRNWFELPDVLRKALA